MLANRICIMRLMLRILPLKSSSETVSQDHAITFPRLAVVFRQQKHGDKGLRNIKVYDVSETDKSYLIAEAFRCGYLVFAAPTYNNGLYPKMKELLEDMQSLNIQGRKCTVLGNGTWAPQSEKLMRQMLSEMKEMEVSEKTVVVRSRLSDAQNEELEAVAEDILRRLQA